LFFLIEGNLKREIAANRKTDPREMKKLSKEVEEIEHRALIAYQKMLARIV